MDCFWFLMAVGMVLFFTWLNRAGARKRLPAPDRSDESGFSSTAGGGGVRGSRSDADGSVAARSQELARNVELASQLGGPGILSTYATQDAAQQLYDNTIALHSTFAGKGELVIQLGAPEPLGSGGDARMQVLVRYVLMMRSVSTQIAGEEVRTPDHRVVRAEEWIWERTPRRCESCGAPSTAGSGVCEYCGAEVRDESRWVLTTVREAAAATAAS